jgi:hypothetical protein
MKSEHKENLAIVVGCTMILGVPLLWGAWKVSAALSLIWWGVVVIVTSYINYTKRKDKERP